MLVAPFGGIVRRKTVTLRVCASPCARAFAAGDIKLWKVDRQEDRQSAIQAPLFDMYFYKSRRRSS